MICALNGTIVCAWNGSAPLASTGPTAASAPTRIASAIGGHVERPSPIRRTDVHDAAASMRTR